MTEIFISRQGQAILRARKVFTEYPVFLDTETTGLTDNYDQVIEVAVVDAQGGELFHSLVRHTPEVEIHPRAAIVHGISEEMLKDAPAFGDIFPQLRDVLQDRHVVIYNAGFDTRMLMSTARAHGLTEPIGFSSTCAMKLYAQYHGEWDSRRSSYRWQSLGAALGQCGIRVVGECHRALYDAESTRQVMLYMAGQKIEGE